MPQECAIFLPVVLDIDKNSSHFKKFFVTICHQGYLYWWKVTHEMNANFRLISKQRGRPRSDPELPSGPVRPPEFRGVSFRASIE